MTFYQELQLNQAGSKNLLKKSETRKEKLYHMWVYLVKIAATMAFCFFFVSIFSILFGNENSIVGVVVLLCLMVFRNADLGIHTGLLNGNRVFIQHFLKGFFRLCYRGWRLRLLNMQPFHHHIIR